MKKRNKFIFLATLSTACLLSLASCQGAQGPKGDQGEPGINGTNGTDGKNGTDGEDGKSVLSGKGVPASSLGTDGDSYIDTETFDFYVKASGTWTKEGNIKGATGDKGDAGSEGVKGEDGTSVRTGKGEPSESLGNDGDSYIDLSNFDFYVKEDGKWSKEGSIKGEQGDKGDKGDKGNNGSSGTPGAAGKPGATAWSNTILPSNGGYVTVDKGSAVADDKTTVTFTIVPTGDDNVVTGFSLDGGATSSIKLLEPVYEEGQPTKKMTCTVKMQENGFIVKADFGNDKVAFNDEGKMYKTLKSALEDGGNITLLNNVTLGENATITKPVTLKLNGHTLDFGSNKITIGTGGSLSITNNGKEVKLSGSGNALIEVDPEKGGGAQRRVSNPVFGGLSTFSRRSNILSANTNAECALSIGSNVVIESTNNDDTSSAIKVTSGKVELLGDVSCKGGKAVEVSGGDVTVSGSVSSESGTAVSASAGSVSVNTGASVSSKASDKAAISIEGSAKTTISGTVSSDGIAVEVKGGEVEVSGSVSSTKGTAVSASAGSVSVKASASVSSDSDTSAAVAVSGNASVAVSGTVSSTKGTAVEVTGGSLTVKNDENSEQTASISGKDNGVKVSSGSVSVASGEVKTTSESATGAAISIDSSKESTITVEVTGGTIKNENTESGSAIKQTGATGTATVVVSGKDTKIVDSENKEGSTDTVYYTMEVTKNSKVQLVKDSEGNKSVKINISGEEDNISTTLSNAIIKGAALDTTIENIVIKLPSTGTSKIRLKELDDQSKIQEALRNKNVTLEGSLDENNDNALLTKYDSTYVSNKDGEYGAEYTFQYAKSVTLKNLDVDFGNSNYTGFIRGNDYTLEGCTLRGQIWFMGNGTAKFNKCTFVCYSGGYVTTYSCKEYYFTDCTFNETTSGRFINCYQQTKQTVKIDISGCTFNGNENSEKPVLCVKLCAQNAEQNANFDINWASDNKVEGNTFFDDTTTKQIDGDFKVGAEDGEKYGYGYYGNIFGIRRDDKKEAFTGELETYYKQTKITVGGVVRFSDLKVTK